jgi:AraC-like DNA-binding protein
VDIPHRILPTGEVLARDTSWTDHSHPTHELLWNARGVSTASIGPRTWTITPHQGLWIPAGTAHHGWAPGGTWHRAAQLSLRIPAIATEPTAVRVSPLLRLLLQRLQDEDLAPNSRALTEQMVLDVLEPTTDALLVHVPEHPNLEPIVRTVLLDPADATPLEDWAVRTGVSSRTLTRTFVSQTGLGFRPWVTRVRAQRALALLADGHRIDEASAQVGYRSASAFIAALRRLTGTTPQQFRQG